MSRYRSLLDMLRHKTLIAEEIENNSKRIDYVHSVSSFLEYAKDNDRTIVTSWFSQKQLDLLKISLDLVIVMFANALVGILNFLLIKNIVVTYIFLTFLVATIIFQTIIYIIGKIGEKQEESYLSSINAQTPISLESLLRCPVKILASEEDNSYGILYDLHYKKWIENQLTSEKLENYNILKKEYDGTLTELLKVLRNL